MKILNEFVSPHSYIYKNMLAGFPKASLTALYKHALVVFPGFLHHGALNLVFFLPRRWGGPLSDSPAPQPMRWQLRSAAANQRLSRPHLHFFCCKRISAKVDPLPLSKQTQGKYYNAWEQDMSICVTICVQSEHETSRVIGCWGTKAASPARWGGGERGSLGAAEGAGVEK